MRWVRGGFPDEEDGQPKGVEEVGQTPGPDRDFREVIEVVLPWV